MLKSELDQAENSNLLFNLLLNLQMHLHEFSFETGTRAASLASLEEEAAKSKCNSLQKKTYVVL